MYYDKLNWKLNIAKQIERPGSQFFTAGFQKNYNVHDYYDISVDIWKTEGTNLEFFSLCDFFFQPNKSGWEASFNQSDSRNNSSLNPNRGPGHQVWHRLKSGIQENCVSCWKKASFLERETKSKRRTPMKKEKERLCVREKLNWKV